jgi:outer membrane protein assembly factor BamD (BamD/ComL family)
MKIKIIVLSLCFCALTSIALAQNNSSKQTDKIAQENSQKNSYQELVVKLKNGEANFDYKALRTAFVGTKEYSYAGLDKEARNKMFKSLNDKNYKDALKQAEKILDKNYIEINAHYVAYISNRELKDGKKSEFHKTVMVNLLEAVRNGNDGLSAKTAFMPITIDEEYTLMNFMGYKHNSQSLQTIDGHKFDVFDAVDSKTNEAKKLYFNIDVIWKAETAIFEK